MDGNSLWWTWVEHNCNGRLPYWGAIAKGDDRYKLFAPYKRDWAGGMIGKLGVQAKYWAMQFQDRLDEAR